MKLARNISLPLEKPITDFSTKQSLRPVKGIKCLEGDTMFARPEAEGEVLTLSLEDHLHSFAEFIANVTESYSACIFLADNQEQILTLLGLHTLSRDVARRARIPFSSGLVGWVAAHRSTVSVSPFEHDATTLLYYLKDQSLKSFLAVPILDNVGRLLGVISCDSKKNYAFAKMTEKLLADCAKQIAAILSLHASVASLSAESHIDRDEFEVFLEQLRLCKTEDQLLSFAASLPATLAKRDALVIVTVASGGISRGKFYSAAAQNKSGHRLLEMVCKHKKVICGDRTVQAMPTDEMEQRSFLSVPFQVLEREAGSICLLSHPREAFDAGEVEHLEHFARVVGNELERIRLRERFLNAADTCDLQSWKHFALHGMLRLNDTKTSGIELSLVRISINNIPEIEGLLGAEAASQALQKVMRLVEQIKRDPAIACFLYGIQILVLMPSKEVDNFAFRLRNLVERMGTNEISYSRSIPGLKLGKIIADGLEISAAHHPDDGESLLELVAKSQQLLQGLARKNPLEEIKNVGNWS